MIKYDYKIERTNGINVDEFFPVKELLDLPNAVYIKGPNSLGKSTLLNILALAFYGNEASENEMQPQLKEKLESLMDTTHQTLTFNVQINNEVLGDNLLIEKDNPNTKDITIYRMNNGNKKPISPDLFTSEFKLIYDIPTNPLERLPSLLVEVQNGQREIGDKIHLFRSFLQETVSEIRDSKDPNQIIKVTNQIDTIKSEIAKGINENSEREDEHKLIEQFYLLRTWISLEERIEAEKKEQTYLEKNIKSLNRDGQRTIRERSIEIKELREKEWQTKHKKSDLKFRLESLLPKKLKDNYEIWRDADIEQEIYSPDINDYVRTESKVFHDWFLEKYENLKNQSTDMIEKVNLYESLLGALDAFQFKETLIPGLNQPVKEFVAIIQSELTKHQDSLTNLNSFQSNAKELQTFINLIEECIELAKRVKSNTQYRQTETYDYSDAIKKKQDIDNALNGDIQLKDQIGTKIAYKHNEIREVYKTIQSDGRLQLYLGYNDDQLREKIDSEKRKIEDCKINLSEQEKLLIRATAELERLTQKKPHPYFNSLSSIESLFQISLHLEKRITQEFSDLISYAIAPKSKHLVDVEESKKYYNDLFTFLGRKIRNIKHIDTEYQVCYVDVFSKKIGTLEGNVIYFGDLGTGQGQATYLEALLNMNKGRKIIALFDEVATMDEKSLQPVKEKIKELYLDGKLFAAIIVHPDEEISVESLI